MCFGYSLPAETAIGRERFTKLASAQTSASLCDLRTLTTGITTVTAATGAAMVTPGDVTSPGSDDIVVLNANGEQGVLTPSPEHRPVAMDTGPHVGQVLSLFIAKYVRSKTSET